jgi:hypothetical protein
VVAVMSAATYAAAMCAAFLVGVTALGALAIYLLDRVMTRRDRCAESPRDPYADAQALAARRRLVNEHSGCARVPAHVLAEPEPAWRP